MAYRDSPARPSMREQIAAKRAEARNSPAGKRLAAAQAAAANASTSGHGYGSPIGKRGTAMTFASPEKVPDKTVESEVKRAARTGKLDLSSMSLDSVPSEIYTSLLGIPPEELSNPPPRPEALTDLPSARNFDPNAPPPKGLTKDEERALVFGSKAVKRDERWEEPEELTSFRIADNKLQRIEREIGMFGGLERLDLGRNMLKELPDSVSDLLRLTTIDLSGNAYTAIPRSVLVLPALQVLDISGNALTSLSFDSPIGPSEDGLGYGIGFFTTSFQRQQELKAIRPVFPALRSFNLGHNKLTVQGLAALQKTKLKAMRVLNLESNNLQGVLDLEEYGMGQNDMPILASLILSRNTNLRGVNGSVAPGAQVETLGCNLRESTPGPSSTTATATSKGVNSGSDDGIAQPTDDDTNLKQGDGKPVPNPDLTLVYRTLPAATFDSEPLPVDFDVYLPSAPSSDPKGHPLVVWFHGGGLLQGNKENLPPHFRRLPSFPFSSVSPSSGEEEHIAVISPNYRLAPQAPILEILDDITQLLGYIRTKLNDRLIKEGKKDHLIDTSRICLSGGSAGGYLALIAGLDVPKSASDEVVGGYRGLPDKSGIKCLAPFYPITDLTDKFWATETDPVPWKGTSVPHAEAKPHLIPKSPPICTAISGGPRSILYPYMLQHALFPSLLFQTQKSIGYGLDAFRPSPESLSIPQRLDLLTNSSSASGADQTHLLPTYFVYGTIDDKVQPMEKTLEAFDKLDQKLGSGRFVAEKREGADHAFDEDPEEECEAFREWLGRTLL
ncbi:hypothetical protein I316_05499 [Kwoniella heveanensis BCC8398]|uniref:BD-FAE-like domain-containing protein n=1 Tax=Kwoniella heveanensis BCC8398 TaxID=1296120 RepID=A0A1B9GP79_9TREE|nr:hypothetical protein I316_05499 [Kwoniella heveanensis BCC8398]